FLARTGGGGAGASRGGVKARMMAPEGKGCLSWDIAAGFGRRGGEEYGDKTAQQWPGKGAQGVPEERTEGKKSPKESEEEKNKMKHATMWVGPLGQGIWRSSDGGDTWLRVRHGIYSESAVRALAVHPSDARIMYCGADSGIYRSEDKGEHWEWLDSPMNEIPVWAVAIDPVDPNIIFAGTRPSALFRSKDGGLHWDKLPVQMAEGSANRG